MCRVASLLRMSWYNQTQVLWIAHRNINRVRADESYLAALAELLQHLATCPRCRQMIDRTKEEYDT